MVAREIVKGIKSNNLVSSVNLNWTLFDGLRMFATRDKLAEFQTGWENLVYATRLCIQLQPFLLPIIILYGKNNN